MGGAPLSTQRRAAPSIPLLLYPLISHGAGLSPPLGHWYVPEAARPGQPPTISGHPWYVLGPPAAPAHLDRPCGRTCTRSLPRQHPLFPPPAQWYGPLLPTAVSGSVLPGVPTASASLGPGSGIWDGNRNQDRDLCQGHSGCAASRASERGWEQDPGRTDTPRLCGLRRPEVTAPATWPGVTVLV